MLNKLERKYKNFGIPHLIIPILSCYVLGYILSYIPQLSFILDYTSMNPYYITRGQIWRLFTWIIAPQPASMGVGTVLSIVMVFIYFQVGMMLEKQMGKFKFNVFVLGGIVITDIGLMVLYGLFVLLFGSVYGFSNINEVALNSLSIASAFGVDTSYIFMSLFLAMSALSPGSYIRLWFIIPIKMKYLYIVYIAFTAIDAVQVVPKLLNYYVASGDMIYLFYIISYLAVILFAVANYLLFLASLGSFSNSAAGRSESYQRVSDDQQPPNMRRDNNKVVDAVTYRHKCVICGRKDSDFPNMEFRYCSKCSGSREYCSEHLFTHTHIQ